MQGPDKPLQCVGCALGSMTWRVFCRIEITMCSYVAVARATLPELTELRGAWACAALLLVVRLGLQLGLAFHSNPGAAESGSGVYNLVLRSGHRRRPATTCSTAISRRTSSIRIRASRAAARTSSGSVRILESMRRGGAIENRALTFAHRLGAAPQHVRQGRRSRRQRGATPRRCPAACSWPRTSTPLARSRSRSSADSMPMDSAAGHLPVRPPPAPPAPWPHESSWRYARPGSPRRPTTRPVENSSSASEKRLAPPMPPATSRVTMAPKPLC